MKKEYPSASLVKDMGRQVTVGRCLVYYSMLSGDSNSRYPWRVMGPADETGDRQFLSDLDSEYDAEHASYREAIAEAERYTKDHPEPKP